jgi:hypothetical protein
MATESMSFIIKRIDSDQQTWDSCQVPYRPKGLNKNVMFEMVGDYLAECTRANRGLPPLCMSHDGHGNSKLITNALNGLLIDAKMREASFFEHCLAKHIDVPCSPYGALLYAGKEDLPVLGHRDGAHGQKNQLHQDQSPKDIRGSGAFVSFVPALVGMGQASLHLHLHTCPSASIFIHSLALCANYPRSLNEIMKIRQKCLPETCTGVGNIDPTHDSKTHTAATINRDASCYFILVLQYLLNDFNASHITSAFQPPQSMCDVCPSQAVYLSSRLPAQTTRTTRGRRDA